MPKLTRQKLMEDIKLTMHEIVHLKEQIKQCTDLKETRRLQRRVRELQYLQLWRHDLLNNNAQWEERQKS